MKDSYEYAMRRLEINIKRLQAEMVSSEGTRDTRLSVIKTYLEGMLADVKSAQYELNREWDEQHG